MHKRSAGILINLGFIGTLDLAEYVPLSSQPVGPGNLWWNQMLVEGGGDTSKGQPHIHALCEIIFYLPRSHPFTRNQPCSIFSPISGRSIGDRSAI